MGKIVPIKTQRAEAKKLAAAISEIDGVEAEVAERASGTNPRPVVLGNSSPESWRALAETLHSEHGVDYCSMVTGVHWPEGDEDKK